MKVIKRNGTEVPFDMQKIVNAITKANNSSDLPAQERIMPEQIIVISKKVTARCDKLGHTPTIEEIQKFVIWEIMAQQAYELARQYDEYRFLHELTRRKNTTDDTILTLVECENEDINQENSNKNPTINSTQRDYIAGEVSKDLTTRTLLPSDIVEAHKKGLIHFHDADYFIQHMHNCGVINLEDALQNGTVITETMIEKPKSLSTACNIATQIIAQTASNQYGGQTFSLAHLAPFVDVSRQKIRRQVIAEGEDINVTYTEDQITSIVNKRLAKEIENAIQLIQYQLVTLMTTNGQTPFVTMFINLDEAKNDLERDDLAKLAEEVFKQRIKGTKNEAGVYITPAFPKIVYVLTECNAPLDETAKYHDLTVLAAKCTAKRMVPDYVSAKIAREVKDGDVIAPMGCRSFLTKDRFADTVGNISNAGTFGEYKSHYYGRFNQGVVTINLVDVACSSNGDFDKFWQILDERLELCHKALQYRHKRLLGTPSDVAPILWQHGVYARLKKGEIIDKLLYNGYSTISLGYAGLSEMCIRMTGKSHTDPSATDFALSVMQRLNDKCEEWKKAENIDYSVYGTPLESTTYKFAKCLKDRFGIIPDVTDHNYITNSYHVNVRENIDAFDKLTFEAQFQKLSPGGAISYVECPDMQDNIPAVLKIMDHIYNHIMYAELNNKSDYCQCCGYDGEIKIIKDDDGKLIWECPCCGNRDQNKMNVARRTCGYIGTQFWNQGRTEEIQDRVLHVSNNTINN